MEQEIIRGFFSLEGIKLSKTMKGNIGALTLVEAHDPISIYAAHCGWDLTVEEAAYFRTLVNSVRDLNRSALSESDFAAKFFDCSVMIKSFSNKIKDYGTGKHRIKVFHIKDGNKEKWLVVAKSVFQETEEYRFEDINWLKRIKDILQSDFSEPNLSDNRAKMVPSTQPLMPADLSDNQAIVTSLQPQRVIEVLSDHEEDETKIFSKLIASPKFKRLIENLAKDATPQVRAGVSTSAPVRYTTMKEPRLLSTSRHDFDKFREDVADQMLYPGCLQYWIPNNLISTLALVWDARQGAARNEYEIMDLLQGDAERALNVINNKLHERDRTAGINMLAIRVNKDGKAPRVEEWFEAVIAALKLVGSKDDDQSKIETIMNAVVLSFPSVKNSFTNRHGLRAWKKLPINEFLVECRQFLADIRLANENEVINQKANQYERRANGMRNSYGNFFSINRDAMGPNEGSNQPIAGISKRVTKDGIISNRTREDEEEDSESEVSSQKFGNSLNSISKPSMSKNTKGKWCFACKSNNPDHIWEECPKLDPTALHFPDRIKQYNEFLENKKKKDDEGKGKKRKELESEGKKNKIIKKSKESKEEA